MPARLLVVLVAALVTSACGGDGLDESLLSNDSAEYVELVAVVSDEMGAEAFTDSENTCLANRIVTEVGADELASMGITGDGAAGDINLSAAQEQILSDSFDTGMQECIDLRGVLTRAGGDDAESICVLDQLPDEQLQTMFSLLFGRSNMTQADIDELNAAANRAEKFCDPGVVRN